MELEMKKKSVRFGSPAGLIHTSAHVFKLLANPNKEYGHFDIYLSRVILLFLRVVVEPARGQVRGGRHGDRGDDRGRRGGGGRYNDK